jgi:hypothetical protein
MALTSAEVDICNQSLGKIAAKVFTFGDVTSNQSVKSLLFYEQTRNALLRKFVWPFARKRLRLVAGWLTDTIYNTDQYVWQSALLYKCAEAHTSGTFTTDLAAVKWVLVSTVSDWATATAYALGETVVNNAILYQCILAHTSGDTDDEPGVGATTATYWKVTTTKPTNIFGYNYDKPANCRRLVENQTINNQNINWNWYGTYTYPKSDRPADTWVLEGNTILTNDTEIDIVYIDTISDTTEWDDTFTDLLIAKLAKKLLAALSGSGPGVASHRTDLNLEIQTLTKDAETIGSQEGNNSGSSDWNNARYE